VDGYLIPDHVYLCKTREGLLFLDLRTDKYLGVSGEGLEHLAALVPGWPIRSAACDALETSERATRMARKLADAGLLTTDLTYGKTAHPTTLETGASSLLQQLSPSRSRSAPLLLARLAYAALKVSTVLKFRSLEYAVREARRRKRATGSRDAAAIVALSSDFIQLRPFVYSSHCKCLYDCLVLLEFLSHSGLFPTLVIGVTTFPFNAHCWLQHGAVVLTDYVERTRKYTPILVI
jgi:Transglutaminase-like superfamily